MARIIDGQTYSVSSSNISSFAYDVDSQTLTVDFNSGDTYEYYDVPITVVEGWRSSASKGKYHHRFIKDSFNYRKT